MQNIYYTKNPIDKRDIIFSFITNTTLYFKSIPSFLQQQKQQYSPVRDLGDDV
jgi:hypothetical protein